MKRAWLLLAAVVALAFGLITVQKWRTRETSQARVGPDEAEKQRIQAFWTSVNEGNQRRLAGKFSEAAAAYRKALEINPTHEESLYYLGNSLFEVGRYSQAAEIYRKILRENPRSNRALAQLGLTLSTFSPDAPVDFSAAREAIRRSVEINREESGPFLRLGLLNLHQGDLDGALENFEIAAGFPSPEGNFLAGYTCFLQGRYPQAARFFRTVLGAWETERKIAARGVLSEGDILPATSKPILTPLEGATLKSALFLEWTSARTGKREAAIPNEFRLKLQNAKNRRFRDVGATAGIQRTGGRGAWADFDNDGKQDLIVVGLEAPVSLYRNLGGRLEDVTGSAGLRGIRNVWDATWADYDGDGDSDLYLVRSGFLGTGKNSLYRNNGDATFTDVTSRVGLEGERATSRAIFFDYDGDNRLDLLEVGNANANFAPVRLFRNQGNRFADTTRQAGLASEDTAVDCIVDDYDRDGKPDLFVLFWRSPGILYRNQGGGSFSNATRQAGLEGVGGNSFSAVFFDYDRDGFPDLLVSQYSPFEDVARCLLKNECSPPLAGPRLFRNNNGGSFEEVSERVELTRLSGTIQALAADMDSDGWEDLVLVNGSLGADRLEPSLILKNEKGERFVEWAALPDPTRPGNFLGAAIADYDGDGDPDLYLGRNSRLTSRENVNRLYLNLTNP